jgi:hypothetical protein
MSGPYRSPAPPPEGDSEAAPKVLGRCLSQHSIPAAHSFFSIVTGKWVELAVHENGLAFHGSIVGGRAELHFDDIDAVHYRSELLLDLPPSLEIVTFDKQRFVIPHSLVELDHVIDAIDRAVTRPILARAKSALATGELLSFGPIALELDGIVLKGRSLSWKHLSYVVAERDSIVVYQGALGESWSGHRFGWVRLVDIPHPTVLLDLLRLRTDVLVQGLRLRAGE